jgi:hypothetical protein
MTNISLRHTEPPFKFWKWIVFGPLFLLAVNYASSLTDNIKIAVLSVGLGFMITVRMIAMRKLNWEIKILSGVGLSLLISSIASLCLYGFCLVQKTSNLCVPSHFRAHVFGNFSFPGVIVVVWVIFEIFGVIGKNIAYAIRYGKR